MVINGTAVCMALSCGPLAVEDPFCPHTAILLVNRANPAQKTVILFLNLDIFIIATA
jgi:hypothetical protein